MPHRTCVLFFLHILCAGLVNGDVVAGTLAFHLFHLDQLRLFLGYHTLSQIKICDHRNGTRYIFRKESARTLGVLMMMCGVSMIERTV